MSKIDVSKCEFITKYDDCRICNGKSLRLHCRDNSNCYYKQLQRYEQCLDEIEKILQEYHPLFTNTPLYMIDKVIRQTKEVKR